MFKDGVIVLSLFDGLAGARLALDRADIPVKTYYSSEIDKYAIKVSSTNYPDIVQLGDINNWHNWDIDQPDLIIGGSPCTGFSVAGKHLNFEDPQSKLFFVYIDILAHYRPRYFLLENVKMKKEWRDRITSCVQEIYPDVEPILINSALVSAQNRSRYYWTNIPDVAQPDDKGILLKDIIHDGFVDRDKSYACTASGNYTSPDNYYERKRGQIVFKDIEFFNDYIKNSPVSIVGTKRERSLPGQRIIIDSKFSILRANGEREGITQDNVKYRKLDPVEYERLQTIPDNYTNHASNTQRYKMIGNGFTIDVIAHILKNMKEDLWQYNEN